jgi:hypothetical protein
MSAVAYNAGALIYGASKCKRSKKNHLTESEFWEFLDECASNPDHPIGRELAMAKKHHKRLYDIHIDRGLNGEPITDACFCSKTEEGGLVRVTDKELRACKGRNVWFVKGDSVVVKDLGSKFVRNAIIQRLYPPAAVLSGENKVNKKKKTKKKKKPMKSENVVVPLCPTCHKSYRPTAHFGYDIYCKWMPKTRKRIAAIQSTPAAQNPGPVAEVRQEEEEENPPPLVENVDSIAATALVNLRGDEADAMDITPMDAPMIYPSDLLLITEGVPLTPPPPTPGGDSWSDPIMVDVDPQASLLSDGQIVQTSADVLNSESDARSILVESKIIKTEPVIELLNGIPNDTLLNYIDNAASPHLDPNHLVSYVGCDPAARDSQELFGCLDRAVHCETDNGRLFKCVWKNKLAKQEHGLFPGPRIVLGKERTIILAVPLDADSGLHFRFASYYPRPPDGNYDRERITFYVSQRTTIAKVSNGYTIVVPNGAVLIEVSRANELRLQVSTIRGGVALLAYTTDLSMDLVSKPLRQYYSRAGIQVQCKTLATFKKLRATTLVRNATVLKFLDERREVYAAEQRVEDVNFHKSPLLNGVADHDMLRRSMGIAEDTLFPHDVLLLKQALAIFTKGMEISDSAKQSGVLRFVPTEPGAPLSILHMVTIERGNPVPILIINGMPFEVKDTTSKYYGLPVNVKEGYEIVPYTSTTDPDRIRAIKEYRAKLKLYFEKCAAQRAYQHEHEGKKSREIEKEMQEYPLPLHNAAQRAWCQFVPEGFLVANYFGASKHAAASANDTLTALEVIHQRNKNRKKRSREDLLRSSSSGPSDLPLPSLAKRARHEIEGEAPIDFAF